MPSPAQPWTERIPSRLTASSHTGGVCRKPLPVRPPNRVVTQLSACFTGIFQPQKGQRVDCVWLCLLGMGPGPSLKE
jgi:hypothetical protein